MSYEEHSTKTPTTCPTSYGKGYMHGYAKGYADALDAARHEINMLDPRVEEARQMPPLPTKEVKVELFPFSTRAYNTLKRDGVNTLFDILDRGEKKLLAIRDFGKTSLKEVRMMVEMFGYTLKP